MTIRRLLPPAAVLAAAGLVLAQPPAKKDAPVAREPAKPAPGSLEDTLDKALRNSADIKAAEAKVRDAEAELNRVRQQVLTKATALHVDLTVARRMLAAAEKSFAILQQAPVKGESLLTAQAMVEKHRGEVEKLETELKSLRGEFAIRVTSAAFVNDLLVTAGPDGAVRVWDPTTGKALSPPPAPAPPAVRAPMMDRVKKLLDQEVKLELDNSNVPDAVDAVMLAAKSDVPVRALFVNLANHTVSLRGNMAVGAWLQAIEDSDPAIRIVVRDYGLLVASRDRLPQGALGVHDLWKGNYVEVKKPEAPKQ
jgi:Outer membrane efflux protein